MPAAAPWLGLDFGTSNTVASLVVDGRPRTLALDRVAADPRLFRSVLFFPEEGATLFGAAGIGAYLDAADGRLLQSLKTFLPVRSFTSTSVRGRNFTLQGLIALFLRAVRDAAKAELGEPVTRVVLGRPARFSEEAEVDGFAEARLLAAAKEAGFEEVVFRIEPLAAALDHEARLDHDELVLTGDFGAGTSDFTVMCLSPARHRELDRRRDILASGGVYVGGDAFDATLMEHELLKHFGADATQRPMGGNRVGMPAYLMRKLLGWHTMSFIRDAETVRFLEQFRKTTDAPQQLDALLDLIVHNLGYGLFRAIERAKVELSKGDAGRIAFTEARIALDVPVTRARFEEISRPLVDRLETTLDGTLARAGIGPEAIDSVVLTGGTSLIPAIGALFDRRFGAARVRRSDAFSAVADGLAVAGAAS